MFKGLRLATAAYFFTGSNGYSVARRLTSATVRNHPWPTRTPSIVPCLNPRRTVYSLRLVLLIALPNGTNSLTSTTLSPSPYRLAVVTIHPSECGGHEPDTLTGDWDTKMSFENRKKLPFPPELKAKVYEKAKKQISNIGAMRRY